MRLHNSPIYDRPPFQTCNRWWSSIVCRALCKHSELSIVVTCIQSSTGGCPIPSSNALHSPFLRIEPIAANGEFHMYPHHFLAMAKEKESIRSNAFYGYSAILQQGSVHFPRKHSLFWRAQRASNLARFLPVAHILTCATVQESELPEQPPGAQLLRIGKKSVLQRYNVV